MTDAECVDFRRVHDHEYADMHVQAGNWTPAEALGKAATEMSQLLDEGLNQPDTLLLTAVAEDNNAVGRVWLSLKHPRGFPKTAYLFYIEVLPSHRGQGLGRRLLEAVEQEAARHGIERISLNVFGANYAARQLYSSSGYEVVTQPMRKSLS
jgi:ribosomal protein S18 acetylase RimI-like enzyme